MKERARGDVNGRLLGIRELMEYTSLGQNTARQMGKDAGAVVKAGRRVLYDRLKIDAYIESLGVENGRP